MQAKDGFFWHRIFICALFIMGNAIITVPLTQNGVFGIIGFIVSSSIGLILALATSLIANKLRGKKINTLIKKIMCGFWLVFLSSMLYDCCRDYVIFTDTTKMPNSSAIVIAVAFLALSIYCGYGRRSVLLRAAVICFLLCCLVLLALVLFSMPRINIENLNINYTQNGIKDLLFKAFLPSVAVYYFASEQTNGVCTTLLGTLIGIALLVITALLCVAVLGNTINLISYPLATVGGIISIGKGFMRFEGFVYLLIILTSFIKASVLSHLILNIFNKNRSIRP